MSNLSSLKSELQNLANPEKAKILQGFFKTGKGQYGEGDVFLGITVPESRKIAKKYSNLSFSEITQLLKSKIHEERLVALLILVHLYQKTESKKQVVDYYLSNTKYINNWDLVDLTADKILGEFLFNNDKSILRQLAKSSNLWERRISIISTFHFIKNNQFDDTLKLSEILLDDKHDLIHKAVGWMLREIGKREQDVLELFLKQKYNSMPRIMLRYAIEKFPESRRQDYLSGKI